MTSRLSDHASDARLALSPTRWRSDRLRSVPSRAQPLALFLQGPVGAFFRTLRGKFRENGYEVLKVNFNGGDWIFDHGRDTINFRGPIARWTRWLEILIQRSRPTVMILFGDCRPYHRAAIEVAGRAGVPIWCLEEGYSRPHFVTCEPGGNNACSPLRRGMDPGEEEAEPPGPPARFVQGNSFRSMAANAMIYFSARALTLPLFRKNVQHRNRHIAIEAFLWSRCLYRKIASYHENSSFLQNLVENSDGKYFVVALQVHDDLQLLCHGRGWTMERLITEVIQSFAQHASAQSGLVFKVHPMDRGHRSYRTFVAAIAATAGCANRVHVVDDGSIGLMIRHSQGVVTVNSTAGLSALNHCKPLLVLGDALYLMPGLAIRADEAGAMDRFWQGAPLPDRRRINAFLRRMHRESLINGNFYLRDGREQTCDLIFNRIHDGIGQAATDGHGAPIPAGPAEDVAVLTPALP